MAQPVQDRGQGAVVSGVNSQENQHRLVTSEKQALRRNPGTVGVGEGGAPRRSWVPGWEPPALWSLCPRCGPLGNAGSLVGLHLCTPLCRPQASKMAGHGDAPSQTLLSTSPPAGPTAPPPPGRPPGLSAIPQTPVLHLPPNCRSPGGRWRAVGTRCSLWAGPWRPVLRSLHLGLWPGGGKRRGAPAEPGH